MDRSETVAIDADAAIDYFSGAEPVASQVAQLVRNDALAIAAPTVFELACGIQTESQRHDLELLLSCAVVLELNAEAAQRAAAVYRDLRSRGMLIDSLDILLAGCCLAHSVPLLSRNERHFRLVPGPALIVPGR